MLKLVHFSNSLSNNLTWTSLPVTTLGGIRQPMRDILELNYYAWPVKIAGYRIPIFVHLSNISIKEYNETVKELKQTMAMYSVHGDIWYLFAIRPFPSFNPVYLDKLATYEDLCGHDLDRAYKLLVQALLYDISLSEQVKRPTSHDKIA